MRSRSRTEKLDCIILRRFPVGENDLIYSAYSAEKGRFRASAQGALRVKNKWRGVLEPFHRIDAEVLVSTKGNLHRFIHAVVVNRPSTFLEDLTALHAAYVVLECLDRFTSDETPAPEIYSRVLSAFGLIDANPDSAGLVVRFFCLEFLGLSGFGLELNQCVRCGKQRPPERSAYCLPQEGGIICAQCMAPDQRQKDWLIHRSTLEIASRLGGFGMDQFSEEDLELFNSEIYRVLQGMFSYHLGEIPKSFKLIV